MIQLRVTPVCVSRASVALATVSTVRKKKHVYHEYCPSFVICDVTYYCDNSMGNPCWATVHAVEPLQPDRILAQIFLSPLHNVEWCICRDYQPRVKQDMDKYSEWDSNRCYNLFLISLVELYMAMGCEQRRCHISTPSTWALPSSTPEFICLHWFESGFGQKVQRWYGSGSYRSRYMEYGATIQHFSTLAHTCPAYAQMETVKPVNWPNMKKMEI